MVCFECNKELADCTCPDIDKRMEELYNDNYLMFKICKHCRKHHQRCKCEKPYWTTSWDNVEICPICDNPIFPTDKVVMHLEKTFCPQKYLGYYLHSKCAYDNNLPINKLFYLSDQKEGSC